MGKNKCEYCGNNPVPHLVYWYNESLNVLLTPVRQAILYNPLSSWLKRSGRTEKFFLALLDFFAALGVLRPRRDAEKCGVRRAQVLWEQAEKRGIKMEEWLLFGHPFDCYSAEKKDAANRRIVFSGLPRPAGYVNPKLDLMDDKWLFKKMMLESALPASAGASVSSFRSAKNIFSRIQKPVIVKPRVGSRGRHSSTFVFTEKDLKKAFWAAKKLCHWVIVEEQLFGPVYRATVVDFRLEGALRGVPPQVEGNGINSISELARQKNARLPDKVESIKLDARAEKFLASQNLFFDSVPTAGTVISLSEKIGVAYGGSSSEDFEICHPDNNRLFVRAAKVVNDPLVGFDFIIPDINRSWKEQRCGFIEVNSLPFINLHHDPLLGRRRNVAAAVWRMIGW